MNQPDSTNPQRPVVAAKHHGNGDSHAHNHGHDHAGDGLRPTVGHRTDPHPPFSDHGHVHSEDSLKAVVNRLSRVEGHIRGIKTMVQESRPCPDVLIQIAAVRGALDRVARLILDEHLTQCVARAAKAGNIDAEIAELKAALDRFLD